VPKEISPAIFFKNTYKILIVIILAVVFFVSYNVYLVDRSMVNLRTALEKATLEAQTIEDFKKIKALLKVPILKEMAKTGVPSKELTYLELAENVTSSATDPKQLEDIKLYLKSIIQGKEKERGGFRAFLDKLNTAVFGPSAGFSMEELKKKEKKIISKISATDNKQALQQLYYDLGNIYLQMPDLEKAKTAFLESSQADLKTALSAKARFNLGWAYKSAGDYDKAREQFTSLAEDYPDDELGLRSRYEIADTLYKKGSYQEAGDYYAKIGQESAGSKENDIALFQAGYISYYNLGDTDTALKYFSKLEDTLPASEITKHTKTSSRKIMASDYNKQGYAMLRVKDYPKALEDFDKALNIAPTYSRSIVGKGLAFYWLGDKEQAIEKAQRAMEIPLEDEVAAINGLFILINCQEVDEAIRLGEEALNYKAMERSEFYYNLGYAYVIKANVDRAYREFSRSIKINPDFSFAYNNLGCSFWVEKKYSAAVSKFKEAVDRGEDYAAPHFNLGVAYFYLNRYEEAYQEFKKALAIDPSYEEAKDFVNKITELINYQP